MGYPAGLGRGAWPVNRRPWHFCWVRALAGAGGQVEGREAEPDQVGERRLAHVQAVWRDQAACTRG